MRLLFDENLSRRLVHQLADVFPDAVHVADLDLLAADDGQIWEAAAAQELAIVTKDDDFLHRALLLGPPPKVIWLRVGNCTTAQVALVLRHAVDRVNAHLADPDAGLLILPSSPTPTRRYSSP